MSKVFSLPTSKQNSVYDSLKRVKLTEKGSIFSFELADRLNPLIPELIGRVEKGKFYKFVTKKSFKNQDTDNLKTFIENLENDKTKDIITKKNEFYILSLISTINEHFPVNLFKMMLDSSLPDPFTAHTLTDIERNNMPRKYYLGNDHLYKENEKEYECFSLLDAVNQLIYLFYHQYESEETLIENIKNTEQKKDIILELLKSQRYKKKLVFPGDFVGYRTLINVGNTYSDLATIMENCEIDKKQLFSPSDEGANPYCFTNIFNDVLNNWCSDGEEKDKKSICKIIDILVENSPNPFPYDFIKSILPFCQTFDKPYLIKKAIEKGKITKNDKRLFELFSNKYGYSSTIKDSIECFKAIIKGLGKDILKELPISVLTNDRENKIVSYELGIWLMKECNTQFLSAYQDKESITMGDITELFSCIGMQRFTSSRDEVLPYNCFYNDITEPSVAKKIKKRKEFLKLILKPFANTDIFNKKIDNSLYHKIYSDNGKYTETHLKGEFQHNNRLSIIQELMLSPDVFLKLLETNELPYSKKDFLEDILFKNVDNYYSFVLNKWHGKCCLHNIFDEFPITEEEFKKLDIQKIAKNIMDLKEQSNKSWEKGSCEEIIMLSTLIDKCDKYDVYLNCSEHNDDITSPKSSLLRKVFNSLLEISENIFDTYSVVKKIEKFVLNIFKHSAIVDYQMTVSEYEKILSSPQFAMVKLDLARHSNGLEKIIKQVGKYLDSMKIQNTIETAVMDINNSFSY